MTVLRFSQIAQALAYSTLYLMTLQQDFLANGVKQILNRITLNESVILLLIITPLDFKEEGV